MIIATIPHMSERMTVEVVDVFTAGDGRKLAMVRALSGHPFTQHSFTAGPVDSDTANFPVALLGDVAVTAEMPAAVQVLLQEA